LSNQAHRQTNSQTDRGKNITPSFLEINISEILLVFKTDVDILQGSVVKRLGVVGSLHCKFTAECVTVKNFENFSVFEAVRRTKLGSLVFFVAACITWC